MTRPFAAPAPWEALNELPLTIQTGGSRGVYTLRVGQYGNRRPAFQVFGPQQEPWETLTTNLPEELLGDDEVHVKVNVNDIGYRALLREAFFEVVGEVPSGHVAVYAEVWRLKPCFEPGKKYLIEDSYRIYNFKLTARAFEDAERAEEASRRLQGKPTRKREVRGPSRGGSW